MKKILFLLVLTISIYGQATSTLVNQAKLDDSTSALRTDLATKTALSDSTAKLLDSLLSHLGRIEILEDSSGNYNVRISTNKDSINSFRTYFNNLQIEKWTDNDTGITFSGKFRIDSLFTNALIDIVDTSEIVNNSIPLKKLADGDYGDFTKSTTFSLDAKTVGVNEIDSVVSDNIINDFVRYSDGDLTALAQYSTFTKYQIYNAIRNIRVYGYSGDSLVKIDIIYNGYTGYEDGINLRVKNGATWDNLYSSGTSSPTIAANKNANGFTSVVFTSAKNTVANGVWVTADIDYRYLSGRNRLNDALSSPIMVLSTDCIKNITNDMLAGSIATSKIADGDKGDVTFSSGTITVDAGALDYANLNTDLKGLKEETFSNYWLRFKSGDLSEIAGSSTKSKYDLYNAIQLELYNADTSYYYKLDNIYDNYSTYKDYISIFRKPKSGGTWASWYVTNNSTSVMTVPSKSDSGWTTNILFPSSKNVNGGDGYIIANIDYTVLDGRNRLSTTTANPYVIIHPSRVNPNAISSSTDDKVVLRKLNSYNAYIYHKRKGNAWFRYTLQRDTTASVSLDTWRMTDLQKVDIADGFWNSGSAETYELDLMNPGEWQHAIQLSGYTWMGGFHGYEKYYALAFEVDGKVVDFAGATDTTTYWDGQNVNIVQSSYLISQANGDSIITVHSRWEWNNQGHFVSSLYNFDSTTTIETTYLAMLPLLRGANISTVGRFIEQATTKDISSSGFTIEYAKSVGMRAWNTTNNFVATMEVLNPNSSDAINWDSVDSNLGAFISNSASYNKFYIPRFAKASGSETVTAGTQWRTLVKYTFDWAE